jgi:hypothetical protein
MPCFATRIFYHDVAPVCVCLFIVHPGRGGTGLLAQLCCGQASVRSRVLLSAPRARRGGCERACACVNSSSRAAEQTPAGGGGLSTRRANVVGLALGGAGVCGACLLAVRSGAGGSAQGARHVGGRGQRQGALSGPGPRGCCHPPERCGRASLVPAGRRASHRVWFAELGVGAALDGALWQHT